MAACPDKNCEEQRKKDHDDVTVLKSRWKALAYGISILGLICTTSLGLWNVSQSRAQDRVEAKAIARVEKDNEQDKEIQDVKIDVTGIKKDIEYIKQSQKRQEENDKEIINVLRKLNGDE
jgi:hypothetical protein